MNDLINSGESTFLTEMNIRLLKRMFKDKEKYTEYLETLWALRKSAGMACSKPGTSDGYDTESPYFRLFKMANDFIGALDDGRVTSDIISE